MRGVRSERDALAFQLGEEQMRAFPVPRLLWESQQLPDQGRVQCRLSRYDERMRKSSNPLVPT